MNTSFPKPQVVLTMKKIYGLLVAFVIPTKVYRLTLKIQLQIAMLGYLILVNKNGHVILCGQIIAHTFQG